MGPKERDQSLRLGLAHAQVGHEDPLLDTLGVPDPAGQILVSVLECASGDVGARADVGQIRTDHSPGSIDSLKRMAADAALGHEQLVTGGVLRPLGFTLCAAGLLNGTTGAR